MSIDEILKECFIIQPNERIVKIGVRPYFNNGVLAPIFRGYKVVCKFPNQKLRLGLKLSFGPMVSIALLVLGQEPHECSRYRAMVLRAP